MRLQSLAFAWSASLFLACGISTYLLSLHVGTPPFAELDDLGFAAPASGDSEHGGGADTHAALLSSRHKTPDLTKVVWNNEFIFGCGVAFLGSLFSAAGGIGGGALYVPLLVMVFHIPAHYAVPLSKVRRSSSCRRRRRRRRYCNCNCSGCAGWHVYTILMPYALLVSTPLLCVLLSALPPLTSPSPHHCCHTPLQPMVFGSVVSQSLINMFTLHPDSTSTFRRPLIDYDTVSTELCTAAAASAHEKTPC
jgi:hypothetical protein